MPVLILKKTRPIIWQQATGIGIIASQTALSLECPNKSKLASESLESKMNHKQHLCLDLLFISFIWRKYTKEVKSAR